MTCPADDSLPPTGPDAGIQALVPPEMAVECGMMAGLIRELKMDDEAVTAALVCTPFLKGRLPAGAVASAVGPRIFGMLEKLREMDSLPFNPGTGEGEAESFRKMVVAMAGDVRVLIVKLVDRLVTLRLNRWTSDDHRLKLAVSGLRIYAPIAARLGLHGLRSELEDLSFRHSRPDEYHAIVRRLEDTREERERYVAATLRSIGELMRANGVAGSCSGRSKHVWSIHRKMTVRGVDFERMFDIIAFRVVTDSVESCYRMLGLLHTTWEPVEAKLKDYIARPKPNGYQSLHTHLRGPEGRVIEVQIRTVEMHRVAEEGVAAHWKYKDRSARDGQRMVDSLRSLLEESRDEGGAPAGSTADIFDTIFVFTPDGDVKELPRGATALDFAYAVHTEVGHRCTGAVVNGRIQPIRFTLKSGDIVSINTSPSQRPRADWVNYVQTSKARAKVRYFLKGEERERRRAAGQAMIEREMKRLGLNLRRLKRAGDLDRAAREERYRDFEEYAIALGHGSASPRGLLRHLVPEERLEEPHREPVRPVPVRTRARRSRSPVAVDGFSDVMVRYAGCCQPVAGDRITGFVTRTAGVTIHRTGCERLGGLDPQRLVEAHWNVEAGGRLPARLLVESHAEREILPEVTALFRDQGVDVQAADIRPVERGLRMVFRIEVADVEHLERVIAMVRKIRHVSTVRRVSG